VASDSSSGGFSDVHAEVDSFRTINLSQRSLHALGELDHFVGSDSGQFLQFIEMSKWHHHHVAGGVGVGIQNDVAGLATVNDADFGIVANFWQVTENAA
jgi:hypothetical protein